jgi:hypothetical protein
MLILDSPGRLVGYIHCRTCCRCVHVDPEMFPPAPHPTRSARAAAKANAGETSRSEKRVVRGACQVVGMLILPYAAAVPDEAALTEHAVDLRGGPPSHKTEIHGRLARQVTSSANTIPNGPGKQPNRNQPNPDRPLLPAARFPSQSVAARAWMSLCLRTGGRRLSCPSDGRRSLSPADLTSTFLPETMALCSASITATSANPS